MNAISRARVGVLGATGYTGRELVRLLAEHPRAQIVFATSESEAGRPLQRLARRAPDLELVRSEDADLNSVDVVFSCLPHGASALWCERARAAGARVVDLSSDLRVIGEDSPEWAREAVYGLPELHRERLRGAELVANPGCYPTAAVLAAALGKAGYQAEQDQPSPATARLTGAAERSRAARAVIVIWSKRSAASGTVHSIAGEARRRQTLIQVVTDDGRAPRTFADRSSIPLSGWNGEESHP
ncbi:MAG: hypothetical protein KY464_17715, partial [Gemmatimonadetes bacterium]|nr:hypothetical protein [Gemmatimonadota bacterium]